MPTLKEVWDLINTPSPTDEENIIEELPVLERTEYYKESDS
tara:strand:+ start:2890 stop:3012 length:123 start_codon:yes stop_codon:yes gene_type:complete